MNQDETKCEMIVEDPNSMNLDYRINNLKISIQMISNTLKERYNEITILETILIATQNELVSLTAVKKYKENNPQETFESNCGYHIGSHQLTKYYPVQDQTKKGN